MRNMRFENECSQQRWCIDWNIFKNVMADGTFFLRLDVIRLLNYTGVREIHNMNILF